MGKRRKVLLVNSGTNYAEAHRASFILIIASPLSQECWKELTFPKGGKDADKHDKCMKSEAVLG